MPIRYLRIIFCSELSAAAFRRITSIVEQIYGIGIKGCSWADLSI